MLWSRDADAPAFTAFTQALRELGWIEGQNVAFEYRSTDGRQDRFPALVQELPSNKVDIIVSTSGRGALAAKQLTQTVPIVVMRMERSDSRFVDSLGRPGGNVTGVSAMGSELDLKRLELIMETVPGISKVALLSARYNNALADETDGKLFHTARSRNVRLYAFNARNDDEFEAAFASMAGIEAAMPLAMVGFATRKRPSVSNI